MDIGLLLLFLASAALLFIAFRYGLVGGGGGVTFRKEQPTLYWLGVVVVGLSTVLAFVALVSSSLHQPH